ncbi:hypothetical protein CTAYLR_008775 [Chrysophaeum taylorii]|uniref:Cas1p 10 TM acyl transferase domain-containing protein n=1 Tax=Chrysophaeum taylorii TaxID=2483200 RepID=A0AAD7UCQ8_9STRA|nr:hypothetical protein CTAYLR_008775 [Chrysophaeum taylorii]
MRGLLFVLLLLFWGGNGVLREVTIKVLTQRRARGLERVLGSLRNGSYPSTVSLPVEIFVDALDDESHDPLTLAVARGFEWPFPVSIITSPHRSGVRGQWLQCADPSVFGDEMRRVLIVEDDVELSSVWFEFLERAVGVKNVAGVSLQRQPYRLDGYGKEFGLKKRTMAPLFREDDDAEIFAFAHVGSWGFSPDPWVWLEFLRTFDVDKWSVSADGLPRAEAVASGAPFRESLPSRWYRQSENRASTWTAHFDAFMAEKGLFVVHAKLPARRALAVSYRDSGEHYALASPDSVLLSSLEWNGLDLDFDEVPRVALSGERLSESESRLLLDVFWRSDDTVTTDTAAAVQGYGFGNSFPTVSRDQAICVLDGKKVAIIGDSISRYFTWQFNWFLRYGTLNPEFEETATDSSYYDQNVAWVSTGYRSQSARHRQNMRSASNSYFDGVGATIDTTFWFIQDTWYPDLEDIAPEITSEYDVLIANSGWWERNSATDLDGNLIDGVDCTDAKMYTDSSCLDAYGADLDSLYDGILASFVDSSSKAVVFRLSSCCGGGPYATDAATLEGSIAVSAMNAKATQVLTDYGVEVLDVEHLISNVNINVNREDDPSPDSIARDDRSFDGTHPRAAHDYVWTQMLLWKIAKQLGREESCFGGSPTRSPSSNPTTLTPTTSEPTKSPTPRPTASLAPTTAGCINGIQDGAETDVDCGGPVCEACAAGKACAADSDCSSLSCFSGSCVPSPSPAPTPAPTLFPSPKPTAAPSTGLPTAPPTISSVPSSAPAPKPTFGAPAPTAGENCEDSYAGCPPPTPLEVCQGDTCFACIDVKDDGVRYERKDSEWYRVFGENCPSAGQRLMLALFLALLACLGLLLLLGGGGDGGGCAADAQKRLVQKYRTHSSNNRDTTAANNNNLTTTPPPPPPPPPPQVAGGKGALEDELSGSALRVLKQMEAQEERYRSARGGGNEMEMTHTHKTSTLGAIAEDAPIEEASSHVHHSRPRNHTSSSYRAGGATSSRYARTTQTGFSQKLTWSNHVSVPRSARFAEPYSHNSSNVASSVAFSFYDGGDSDDDDDDARDDDDDDTTTAAPHDQALVPKPKPASSSSSSSKPRGGPGPKTYAAATTALEMALILVACVVGEHRMPSGYLPAASRYQTENIDLWTFVMVALLMVSVIKLKVVDPESASSSSADNIFLSRAQANEWKGWMQVAFVAYHYTNAQDVYVPVRWFVSAYVWLSGFGNGVYFWTSADFSFKRFAQQLWRINFLCLLLSLATATPWIDYYFVALATIHFILIWLALAIARLLGKHALNFYAPDRKAGVEAHPAEKAIGIVLLLVFVVAIWGQGTPDNFGSGSLVYKKIFQGTLRAVSTHTENYFWTRTKMDYLSSAHGLAFAAIYSKLRDAWPTFGIRARLLAALPTAAALAVAIFVAKLPRFCCRQGLEYRKVNAYIGTLWIPFYLVARNLTPWLANRISTPMEWIGMHSLEFYLLQFHVFLTRRSQEILYVIPNENWALTNMAIVGFLYVIIVVKSLEATSVLRSVAWRASKLKVAVSVLWTLLFYTLFATLFSSDCSPLSWGLWTAFFVIALACLLYWTATT